MTEIYKSGNILIEGRHKRPVMVDVTCVADGSKKPVIIFSHGFKGFKDWGHFNLMAREFANQNFVCVKFNFSHNGITPTDTNEFSDLDAFANNNFSIELDDLGTVIDWVQANIFLRDEVQPECIFLVGHSRGGGISLLKANEDPRIKKVVTWAAPCTFENRFLPEEMEYWKKNGVIYVQNFRTNEMMPMYYQIVEDYVKNKKRIDIPRAASMLKIPCLLVQGTADDVVLATDVEELQKLMPSAELFLLEHADHTFGTTHPYISEVLENDFLKVFNKTCGFLKCLADIKT
ncbi:MAG: alpha/beta hydrolase [Bacteroidetes bacterium]|nr:alpha/beta hydrolase [Bacteroidota bacterium]HET6245121.1 alpha/beta hydrolase [Bacteroidia bacterium]